MDRDSLEALSPVDGVVEFVSLGRAQIVVRSQAEQTEERVLLPVASHLGVEPAEMLGYAVCRPGQTVEVGDLLARVPGLSLLANEYRSPVAGVVESVSALTGTIAVLQDRRPVQLRAFLSGRVERIIPGYGAVVAARGHRVLGVLGLGGKSWGRLMAIGPGPGDAVRAGMASGAAGKQGPGLLLPHQVSSEHAGCVLIAPGEVGAEALHACREHGVRGVIAGSARARALGSFLGRPLAAEIVTGPGALALRDQPGQGRGLADEPGLTVILTEGFGRLAMDDEVLAVLLAHVWRVVSLDGLTQIRAGVVRPMVLLPEEGADAPPGEPGDIASGEPLKAIQVLDAGSRVRIVRHPYFGLRGTVIRPPGGLVRSRS